MTRLPVLFAVSAIVALNTACDRDTMTNREVLTALEESRDSSRGERATAEPIEISTEFTIGDAVDAAAQQMADFWASQEPCTDVTVEAGTILVDYGGLDDDCEFEGNTYGGQATIDIDSTTPGQVQVTHTWDALTDGDVQVDGGAVVTWADVGALSRQVTTDHTWSDVADGTTVDVLGDHTLGFLDEEAGLDAGITLEGTRDWFSESGDWHVDMTGLELRLQDPVAQAGVLSLTNPDGRHLDLIHERIDETTIRVTLTGARKDWVFDVNQLGVPTQVETTDPGV
jgi:hypothetical protein